MRIHFQGNTIYTKNDKPLYFIYDKSTLTFADNTLEDIFLFIKYEFLFITFFLVVFSALPHGNFLFLKQAHAQLEVEIVTESFQLPKRRNSYRRFQGGRRNSYPLAQQQLPIVKIVSVIVGIVTYFHKIQFLCIYLSIYLSICLSIHLAAYCCSISSKAKKLTKIDLKRKS